MPDLDAENPSAPDETAAPPVAEAAAPGDAAPAAAPAEDATPSVHRDEWATKLLDHPEYRGQVELVAAFSHIEHAAGRHHGTHDEFMARLEAFRGRPHEAGAGPRLATASEQRAVARASALRRAR